MPITKAVETPQAETLFKSDAEVCTLLTTLQVILRLQGCTENQLNMVETLTAVAYVSGHVAGAKGVISRLG